VVGDAVYFGTGVVGLGQYGLSDWWKFSTPQEVHNPQNDNLYIFPNPAKDHISVIMPDSLKDIKISYHLAKASGAKVAGGSFTNTTKIDARAFSSGMYFLRLKTPKGIITRKVDVLR